MKTLLALLALAVPVLGAEVSGYVYLPDGSAVEGATVKAGGTSVVTGADGGFVIKDIAEGVVDIAVMKDGVGAALQAALTGDVVTVTLIDSGQSFSSSMPAPPVITRGEGTGVITGRVTLDGKPLNNALVFAGGVAARSNAKGEYKATGMTSERHLVQIDTRLRPRVRSPYQSRMYAEGTEPYFADLRTAREGVVNFDLTSPPMIRGRVVDAEGKPVARARVLLMLATRSTLDFAFEQTIARTAPDGRFAFPAPEWQESEQVNVAVTPLLHSTVRSKPFPLGNGKSDLEIKLPKTETVRVHVADAAGKPVRDARVAFAASSETGALDSIAVLVQEQFAKTAPRTNAEGELVLQLVADAYDFAVAADGFQTATLSARRIAKPMTVDVPLERAAALRGRVHRNDRGVENVGISVLGRSTPGRPTFDTTGPDGKFEITGLAPGTYRIQIVKSDELYDRQMEVKVPADLDIAMPPVGTLRGRVIDASTRAPVTEFSFTVDAADASDPSARFSGVSRGEVSEDGTFTVQLPGGIYRVSVAASGFTAIEPVDVRVNANETTVVDLPLGRGVTVSGRVTDESGAPLADVSLIVVDPDEQRPRARRMARSGPNTADTAADGTFTLTGVEPGEAVIFVRKEGYVSTRKPIDAQGEMTLEIQLSKGLGITGVVTRARKPVAGAQVSASAAAVGAEHQGTVTDDDGRFTLTGLVAARYTVSAYLDELHGQVRDVDPAQRKEVAIAIDPQAKGVVYGSVTGIPPLAAGGKYVRRVVAVYSEDGAAEGTIDDAGNYRIENAPTGTVSVSAVVETMARTARSSPRKEIEVIPGQAQRVDLDLGANVRVSGRVTVDGRPAADAYVAFSSDDGMMGSAQTREDGAYELLLPGPNTYRIFARSDQISERLYQTVREVRGGETIDIDLREQVLEGTVVDAVTRQPIANALVTLAPATGAGMSIAGEMPTDGNGRFRISTAASGPLRLIASAPGYAHSAVAVTSSTTSYEFALTPVSDLRIRVFDGRTGALLEAHVVVTDAAGLVSGRPRRSGDGTTYLFSLAPGKYRVMAMVQGYTPKTVEAEAPGAADVVLE